MNETTKDDSAAGGSPLERGVVPQEPKRCSDREQCSPHARYDEVSHGVYSLTLKCRLCGGIRRSDWD